MSGLANYGACAATVTSQLPSCSTSSEARALCALPAVGKICRTQPLSALRSIHQVAPALLSWSTSPSPDRRRSRGAAMASLSFELSPATIVMLSSAVSVGLVRAFVYFRMEYIIAAMLGRHVPRGGARVVELDIREGRNLYYYPPDVVQVVAVSSKPNRTLLENQAIKAGVPIQIKTRGALGVPANTMDAVVSVYAFRDIPEGDVRSVLREAVKVLQPGQPFIFVEPVGAKNPLVRAAQNALQGFLELTGSKRSVTRDLLQYIQEVKELEDLEYEEVLSFLDPQLVGVAKKKVDVRSTSKESAPQKRGFKKSRS